MASPSNSPVPFVIGAPDYRHNADYFDKNSGGAFRKYLKSLAGKALHAIIMGDLAKKDIEAIRAAKLEPDHNGELNVNGRKYILHAKGNNDGINRLIPVEGEGIFIFQGKTILALVQDHVQFKKYKTFAEHLLAEIHSVFSKLI